MLQEDKVHYKIYLCRLTPRLHELVERGQQQQLQLRITRRVQPLCSCILRCVLAGVGVVYKLKDYRLIIYLYCYNCLELLNEILILSDSSHKNPLDDPDASVFLGLQRIQDTSDLFLSSPFSFEKTCWASVHYMMWFR